MRHFCMVRSLSGMALSVVLASGQVQVLTQHNDNDRTGANLNETILNTANVTADQFGKLFSRKVDGQIYAQPLYVPNVSVAGKGTFNVVYVATEHNSVYAFDADDPRNAEPLWQVNLGPSVIVPSEEFGNRYGPYHDLVPELGITGTPVIDAETGTLYVVAFTKEFRTYYRRLHALDIATGEEKFGAPLVIRGDVAGTGEGSFGGRVIFQAVQAGQRAGLALWNDVLYLTFASHADTRPYHGWVIAYEKRTLRQLGIFNVTPQGSLGREGGIWHAGKAPPVDEKGILYFMTGNGGFDFHMPGGRNLGSSFVKLSLSKEGLAVADWFTPCNQCCLDRNDTDLGSAGPILLPGTDMLVGGGKQGRFYLLSRNNMGQFNPQVTSACPTAECNACIENKEVVQRFQATTGAVFGGPVYWHNSPDGPLIYIWASGDRLKAYRFSNDRFETAPFSQSTGSTVSHPGGMLSLSANGGKPGTGILWAMTPNANSNSVTQTGVLRAFDASDLTRELWTSDLNAAFDSIGNFAKFSWPTIANGKVYVPSFSSELHVYGLLPKNPPPQVSLLGPTPRTSFTEPANVTLSAEAASRNASLAQVNFYAGETIIGSVIEPPYQFTWESVPIGRYTLIAEAVDINGDTARSDPAEIRVVPEAVPYGRVISIDFSDGGAGRGSLMEPWEVAGVVARSIWNSAPNVKYMPFNTGYVTSLYDHTGTLTGASLAWTANGTFHTSVPDDPGDSRMMKNYLDTSNTSTTLVTVYNLPESFSRNGYDVYVYLDGDNGSAARTAEYAINNTIKVRATDAADTDFSGAFAQALAGSEGNYIIFPGLTGERFTLSASPGVSSDATRRAAINGIQIVAREE
jgi:hypothetical protein